MTNLSEPRALLFLTGACLPFVAIGPMVASQFWMSPSIFLSVLMALFLFVSGKFTVRFGLLCFMILVFVATALGRHPISTYIMSIAVLFFVMIPLTLPMLSHQASTAVTRGFSLGLVLTLIILWLEIVLQIFNLDVLYQGLKSLFRGSDEMENMHNFLVFYFRPRAAFAEPAHLGIYLAFSYVIYDQSINLRKRFFKTIILVSIVAVGSLAAIILVSSYLFVKSAQSGSFFIKFRMSRSGLYKIIIGLIVIASVTILLQDILFNILELLFTRFDRLIMALESGALESSEGSRGNAFTVLPEYWSDQGLSGFIFGTGYANSEAWLITNFGHLTNSASFARGNIDNMLVAVFLSTGVIGFLSYSMLIFSILSRVDRINIIPITIFFVTFSFATGTLVAYYQWHLLFVLLVHANLSKARNSEKPADYELP